MFNLRRFFIYAFSFVFMYLPTEVAAKKWNNYLKWTVLNSNQLLHPKDDQRFLRFLWWPGGDLAKKAEVYAMTVHLFGATSSPSVAGFCMRKTADDNETKFSDTAVATLRRSFYVDDMLKSVASVEEGVQLHKEMTELLKRGGFRLIE